MADLPGDDERVMERVLLNAHHLREFETTQQLNVEDLLHGALSQSSFRIVPMPRLLVNSELLLLLNSSR